MIIIAFSSLSFAATPVKANEQSNRDKSWNVKQGAKIPFHQSWMRLNGIAETWGSGEVNGSLSINTRTVASDEDVRENSFVNAIWSNTINFREKGNFSYSFYAAKLTEANVSKLDHEGADFFLNGTWNIANITVTQTTIKGGDIENGYTIDRQTKTIVDPIAIETYGELRVTDNWTEFTLSIAGSDGLGGVVTRTRITQMTFNRFKVGEDNTDRVNKIDLSILAKSYGTRPGWGSYDSNMDFNSNYKIDIADLATVAANLQST